MSDDLERLLHHALDAEARRRVGDTAAPPPPRFADAPTARVRTRRRALRFATPLAAAAAVVGVVAGSLEAAGVFGGTPAKPAAGTTTVTVPVRVSALPMPHDRIGVGLPVIAHFSQRFSDAAAWQRATRVTVDGHRVEAAWYFVAAPAGASYAVAGHLRMRHYWPPDATIDVRVADPSVPGGAGRNHSRYVVTGGLDVSFRTGPAVIATIRDTAHRLTLVRSGRTVMHCPVSLGSAADPTMSGTKVVMAKNPDATLRGPGYVEAHVRDTQRLTYSEYLLAAPWALGSLDHGVDSSAGSTYLSPADATKLYHLLRVGDVVRYPDASGPRMRLNDGYGDWNVAWSRWSTGGLIPTR